MSNRNLFYVLGVNFSVFHQYYLFNTGTLFLPTFLMQFELYCLVLVSNLALYGGLIRDSETIFGEAERQNHRCRLLYYDII